MTTPLLRPINDRLLIQPAPVRAETSGGIQLPEGADARPECLGRVVAIGPGLYCEECGVRIRELRTALQVLLFALDDVLPQLSEAGLFHLATPRGRAQEALVGTAHRRSSQFAVGDWVMYSPEVGQEIELEGTRYLMIPEAEILAIVKDVPNVCTSSGGTA